MELNYNNNLFLGKEELNHFKESLGIKGFKRMFQSVINTYGVVKLNSDISFDSLKVISGTSNGHLTVQAGTAVDANVDVISIDVDETDVLFVPSDSVTRYVVAKFAESNVQAGTVSISTTGQVTGVGTNFTEMLRGLPNFPSTVSFNGSVNTGEYKIASITDDTNMQLNIAAGLLVAESAKTYSIVGTFTPGYATPAPSKFPMVGDGYEITLEATLPVVTSMNFVLASAVNDGTDTVIGDLRGSNILNVGGELTSSANLELINPLATVTRGYRPSDRDGNRDRIDVKVEWGFKVGSSDWSPSSSNVIISAGSGGLFSSKVDFTTGDFNGWYVYNKVTGEKVKVSESLKLLPSNDIQLELENTAPTTSSDIVIIPPGNSIQIAQIDVDNVHHNDYEYSVQSINEGECFIKVNTNVTTIVRYKVLGVDSESKSRQLNANPSYLNEKSIVSAFDGDELTVGALYKDAISDGWTVLTTATTPAAPVLKYGGTGNPVASTDSPIPISFRYKKVGTVVHVAADYSLDVSLTPALHTETQMVMQNLPFTLTATNWGAINGIARASSADERVECNLSTTTPNLIGIQVAEYTGGTQAEFANETKRLIIAFSAEVDN